MGGALAKNQTYRAFVARPSHVLDLNGEILDGAPVLVSLASEVRDISAYATYVVRNDEALADDLERVTVAQPAAKRAWRCLIFLHLAGLVGRARRGYSNTTLSRHAAPGRNETKPRTGKVLST